MSIKSIKRAAWAAALVVSVSPFAGLKLWDGGRGPDALALIPYPAKLERLEGSFQLKRNTVLVVSPDASPRFLDAAEIICDKVKERTGLDINIARWHEFEPGQMALKIDTLDPDLVKHGHESYKLKVGREVLIVAGGEHGFFNAGMTLLQLLREDADGWSLPRVNILDYPRFAHRGLHLDPARSFLEMDFLKRYVDLVSEIKLNVLHLHLVDDQGWRLEIKGFPRLHEVGGKDGYYTQEEIRGLLAYAAERQVTIIPEIEMPGHCTAMLAAYPELSCSGDEVKVSRRWGIHRNAMCPCDEAVYEFADKLLAEVASLFPSYYIHIGSDEVTPKDWLSDPRCTELSEKEGLEGRRGLQSYFVSRVNDILKKHGRGMIAWDEIVTYAPEGAVVQSWHSLEKAKQAALLGRQAIVSPINPWYLDYPEQMWSLKDAYLFDPVPGGLSPEQEELIIGGEACMWQERAPQHKIDYKLYPRLLALSEVLWSPRESRDFPDFKARVKKQRPLLEKRGVNFKPIRPRGAVYPVINP